MRIGLLGGSFNPAHAGHLHVAKLALRRLQLDQVWLLVSPGNPLKPRDGMASFTERLATARAIADGRRIVATDIEARLGTRYTWDTLRSLRQRFPKTDFVWIMGADNLAQLPQWQRWTAIAQTMPLLIVPRPSWKARALGGQAASRLRGARRGAHSAARLAGLKAPAWLYLPASENTLSATLLRRTRARLHKADENASQGARR